MTGLPAEPPRRTSRKGSTGPLWRPALFIVGWVCLAIGIAGLVLPLVPGTLFLIFSAACFTRSSPRFEAWLLDHPQLGPPIHRWRRSGSIPRRAKILAVASLVVSWGVLVMTGTPDAVKIGCLVLFCAVALYIVTRPER